MFQLTTHSIYQINKFHEKRWRRMRARVEKCYNSFVEGNKKRIVYAIPQWIKTTCNSPALELQIDKKNKYIRILSYRLCFHVFSRKKSKFIQWNSLRFQCYIILLILSYYIFKPCFRLVFSFYLNFLLNIVYNFS